MVSLALILSLRDASFSSSCWSDKGNRLFRVGQSREGVLGERSRTLKQRKYQFCHAGKHPHTHYTIKMFSDMQCMYVCSCLTLHSYHSVQRQRPPLALRFAGYWGDCCYGILQIHESIFSCESFYLCLLDHFIQADRQHIQIYCNVLLSEQLQFGRQVAHVHAFTHTHKKKQSWERESKT